MNNISTKKILLVDDNPSILEMVQYKLCYHTNILPVNISLASSGNSAIRLINSGKFFDLIVSDFSMADGNGRDLLEFLMQQKSTSYFIFFTSTLNIQLPETNSHFLGVIDKPLLGKLASTIVKALS